MSKTHVISDESLGGIEHEYSEVARTADAGDYVMHNFKDGGGGFFTDNKLYEVIHGDRNGEVTLMDDNGDEHVLSYQYYKTIESTEIIRHEGKRYKLAERKAEVGEKVIIVNAEGAYGMYKNGDVIEVKRLYDSGIENDDVAIGGNSDGLIFHREYQVLEPVESEDWPPLTEESIELTANDIRWQPDRVIDLLANLARRVSSLEAQLADTQGNVQRHGEELEAVRYGNDELYLRLKGVEDRTANHRDELNVIDHEKEMIFSDIVSISKRIRKLNGGAAE